MQGTHCLLVLVHLNSWSTLDLRDSVKVHEIILYQGYLNDRVQGDKYSRELDPSGCHSPQLPCSKYPNERLWVIGGGQQAKSARASLSLPTAQLSRRSLPGCSCLSLEPCSA
jgi:hypothetical protein